jgi:hypothetical protein
MFVQAPKTARSIGALIEAVGDRLGVLVLLSLGLTTAGATFLAGL